MPCFFISRISAEKVTTPVLFEYAYSLNTIMGCGASKIDTKLPAPEKKSSSSSKATCLIFGMPDSGQEAFVSAMKDCFQKIGGHLENLFFFIVVPSERSYRPNWAKEYSNHTKVVASFFFADLTSNASILLSIKSYNWLRSQLVDRTPPNIVGHVKTEKETSNFMTMKEKLPPGVEASTFDENNQSDVQKYLEFIIGSVAKHTMPNEEE